LSIIGNEDIYELCWYACRAFQKKIQNKQQQEKKG
jgi:hypothetical protein